MTQAQHVLFRISTAILRIYQCLSVSLSRATPTLFYRPNLMA